MAWIKYNANPIKKSVGDCTVRAISKSMNLKWESVYTGVALYGFMLCDMPSANAVWGSYLKSRGYKRKPIPSECPDCYTVEDFCRDHPIGNYVLGTGTHAIAVVDGDYYDVWDSGKECPIYFYERED